MRTLTQYIAEVRKSDYTLHQKLDWHSRERHSLMAHRDSPGFGQLYRRKAKRHQVAADRANAQLDQRANPGKTRTDLHPSYHKSNMSGERWRP